MADEFGLAQESAAPDPFALSGDDVRAWRGRVDRALNKQKHYHAWWDKAVKDYSVQPSESPEVYASRIRTGRIYTTVERQLADLFYQRPELTIAPSPLLDQMPEGPKIAAIHAAILNEKLGSDGVDGEAMASQAIFDYQLFGAGWTHMGYRAYTVDTPTPQTDPMTGQPMLDPMTGEPVMDIVPVPIKTECFWLNVSPKQGILPSDWTSTDFDKAPFIGIRFEMPFREVKRLFGKNLPENFKPGGQRADQQQHFDHGTGDSGNASTADLCQGSLLYYKTSLFSDRTVHPDAITELVLLDGVDVALEHRDCPYQEFDAQGKLTPDSLIGYPICPLVIRRLTDSAYVMSDVAQMIPLVNELDTFREQQIKMRDANLLRWHYDVSRLPREKVDQIAQSPFSGAIGLPPEAYETNPNGPFLPMPTAPYPPDNYQTQQIIDNDLSRMTGVDATTSGVQAETAQTATAENFRQSNANVRVGKSQNQVAKWYLKSATKFSTIVQKLFPVDEATQIVGQQDAQMWDQFRHKVPTRFAFTMLPDSSLRNDTPLHKKQAQELYSYLANDPNYNRRYGLERLMLLFHQDPTRGLIPPDQIQPPQPEKKVPNAAFRMEDFSPLAAQSPIAIAIWNKAYPDYAIDQAAIDASLGIAQQVLLAQAQVASDETQQKHGGKLAQTESLDKHQVDETGGMQATGAMMPQMAGGMPGTGVTQ